MDPQFARIHLDSEFKKRSIMAGFVDAPPPPPSQELQKGIPESDFHQQYGSGWEVYAQPDLDRFEKEARAAGLEKSADASAVDTFIAEAKKGLTPLVVNLAKGGQAMVYVRRQSADGADLVK